jgi:predicted nucleic acid-binding protein
MLIELADVMARAKFEPKRLALGLQPDELAARYADFASVVRPVVIPSTAPDPDDDVVIGTALAAGAELTITGDQFLLGVQNHEGIAIVSVAGVLLRLAG